MKALEKPNVKLNKNQEEIIMNEITIEKMQELKENQEFAAKIRTAKSGEEMVKIFAEYDVRITEEELRENCKQTVDILREQGYMDGDELTESGLEMVAGGFNWAHYGGGLGLMGTAIGAAACPPAALLLLSIGAVWAVYGALSR